VDLRVLKSRKLAIAASLTFVLGFALFATVFIVPVFTQRLLGYTAMKTGMLFLPGALVALFFLPMMGRLLTKGFPPQFMVMIGFGIVADLRAAALAPQPERPVGRLLLADHPARHRAQPRHDPADPARRVRPACRATSPRASRSTT
jgi:hypothetical protein